MCSVEPPIIIIWLDEGWAFLVSLFCKSPAPNLWLLNWPAAFFILFTLAFKLNFFN